MCRKPDGPDMGILAEERRGVFLGDLRCRPCSKCGLCPSRRWSYQQGSGLRASRGPPCRGSPQTRGRPGAQECGEARRGRLPRWPGRSSRSLSGTLLAPGLLSVQFCVTCRYKNHGQLQHCTHNKIFELHKNHFHISEQKDIFMYI